MSEDPIKTDNRAEYMRLFDKNMEIFSPDIAQFGATATEYAKIIFRHLFLLNGGALVLVPTVLGNVKGISIEATSSASVWFVVGLVAVLVATYAAHLNFVCLYQFMKNELNERLDDIRLQLLEDSSPPHRPKKSNFLIGLTFWASHIFGIVSVVSLVLGSYKIFGVLQ